MTWLIVAVLGVWIVLSGFILVIACMNSSRFSQMQGPVRRYRTRPAVPKREAAAEVHSNQSPAAAE